MPDSWPFFAIGNGNSSADSAKPLLSTPLNCVTFSTASALNVRLRDARYGPPAKRKRGVYGASLGAGAVVVMSTGLPQFAASGSVHVGPWTMMPNSLLVGPVVGVAAGS